MSLSPFWDLAPALAAALAPAPALATELFALGLAPEPPDQKGWDILSEYPGKYSICV